MSDDTSASVAPAAVAPEEPVVAPSSDAPVVTTPPPASETAPATEEAVKEASEDVPMPDANGTTTAVPVKKEKRKSTGGVPEHKNKKLNRKQSKADLKLNLNVKPGEHWFAIMKGYKPWPSVVCDEAMLPESLLSKRPVSAMRPDGTYREDFLDGAKNARDRRYPVMFLGTNEFAWQVNTELRPLTVEDVKKTLVDFEKKPIQPKVLWAAYQEAAKGHDLDYYKNMLVEHEQSYAALQQAEEDAAAEAEAEANKAVDEDVEMVDADAEPKKKKAIKRKAPKEEEEVDEEGKPLKTPKKIKIKPMKEVPAEISAVKPPKKKAVKKEKDESKPPKSPTKTTPPEVLSPEEIKEKMQKTILFLRHKLQKGFLSRDKPPEEGEMPTMHEHMTQLAVYHDLDASIIKATKINKVLKAMIKLATIPREHEFKFKERAQSILASWSKQLQEDAPPAASNGVAHEEKAEDEPAAAERGAVKAESAVEPVKAETPAEPTSEEPAASIEPSTA